MKGIEHTDQPDMFTSPDDSSTEKTKNSSVNEFYYVNDLVSSQLEASPDGILVIDEFGRIVSSNKRFSEIWGIPSQLMEEKSDEKLLKFVLDKLSDPDEFHSRIKQLYANRELKSREEIVLKDERVLERYSSPLTGACGRYYGRIWFFRDITERKKAEEDLLLTKFAMDNAPESILWVGNEGDIVYANNVLCLSMGYKREELLKKKVFDIDPDFSLAGWEQHKINLKRMGRMEFESRHIAKDGHIFPVEVTTNYLEYKGRFYSCAFDRDITERKEAEATLRRSETAYREIFNLVQDAIYIHDIESYKIIDVNCKTLDLFGYTEDEFKSITLENLCSGTYPYTQDNAESLIVKAASGDVLCFEWQCRQKCGHLFWAEITLKPGTINGIRRVLAIVRDISDRKRMEEEKEKLQAQLLHAQKMDSVGRLAGGVAHDFNNMLSVILGHSELAIDQTDHDDPLYFHLSEIKKAASRSANLTRQLLAFARKQAVVPRVLDLNETVGAMLTMLKQLIGENITLKWKPGKGLWSVKVDPSQIDQIMANLCVNARDAINGIGNVLIETENKFLDQMCIVNHPDFIPGEYVVISVGDNGKGMNNETIDKLFEPFFTTKSVGKGIGLGLATVYGIVKQNNGFIDVYSEPGRGSLFRIFFPRYHGAPDDISIEDKSGKNENGDETILLVEDELSILAMVKNMLEQRGYTVYASSTPLDAIRYARETGDGIQLLITDVVMPEMDGKELSRNLTGLFPNLRTLFMSGYSTSMMVDHGFLNTDVNFIQKPFSLQELIKKIKTVLGSGN